MLSAQSLTTQTRQGLCGHCQVNLGGLPLTLRNNQANKSTCVYLSNGIILKILILGVFKAKIACLTSMNFEIKYLRENEKARKMV